MHAIPVFDSAFSLTTGAASALLAKTLVVADVTYTAAADDVLTFAAAHGLETGDGPLRTTTTGVLPAGLAAATDYWVIKIGATTIKLAASLANAVADAPTAVDITDAGTGVHTLVDTATTKRVRLDHDIGDREMYRLSIAAGAAWVKQGTLPSVAAAAGVDGNIAIAPEAPMLIDTARGRYLAAIQITGAQILTICKVKFEK